MQWAAKVLMNIILFGSLISIQCKNEKTGNSSTEANRSNKRPDTAMTQKAFSNPDSLPTTKTKTTDSFKVARNKLTVELLKKIKTIEVLTIDKENRRIASTGEDMGDKCDKWDLNKTNIEKILKASKPISTHEWHYLYDVIPCYYYGEVKINKQVFSYSINAGSFINISNADTGFLLGCTDKKLEKYFLRKVLNGKEG